MKFAEQLKQIVKEYEDSVDNVVIEYIRRRAKEAALDGKRYIYIDKRLSPATQVALEDEEGFGVQISELGCSAYKISW